MKSSSRFCLLAFALVPLAAAVAHPAPVSAVNGCQSVVVALPAAAETFTGGTLRVQRYGDHGRPAVLIPDQPQKFQAALDKFLAGLPGAGS